MQNRLNEENSLYLRQHSTQPVEWYAWGEEALKAADKSQKPLLISIGYSACHWCHVMAHESFDDPYIAGLMNKHFICVKVDREERPDIDQVYMEAVQMIQQQGGWPLNVFCLPDGRPFFGGTYFPPEDRGNGLIPWPQLLMRIADYYKRSRSELIENADSIQKNILAAVKAGAIGSGSGSWDPANLITAAQGIIGNHDDQYGGFGGAPKFPPTMSLNFLQAVRRSQTVGQAGAELADRIDQVCHKTLQAMAHGGIYDQFGGGFARYSVDSHWLIPHFEKMLYDNALLIDAYTRGWLDQQNPLYAAVVAETIDWLEREMSSGTGAFYAALDADTDGEEGRYYVWEPDEIDTVIGPSLGQEIRTAYNITLEGTFQHGLSNPALADDDFSLRERLAPAREQLRKHRERTRTRPGRDEKISTFWNCMVIRALADAGYYFKQADWLKRARKALDFIWDELTDTSGDRIHLKSVYYVGSGAAVDGFLHDYATAADACLSVGAKIAWLEPSAAAVYYQRARSYLDAALDKFGDTQAIGFFFTAKGVETPVARRKEWFDNATPSGNSVMLHALSGVYALTGDARYQAALQENLAAYSDYSQKVASGVAHALEAASSDALGLIVIKVNEGAELNALRDAISDQSWRRIYIQPVREQATTYQLCVGTQCLVPTDDLAEIVAAL